MPELTPSTREAARRIGITETALRKAATKGRIEREPDGNWDVEKTRRRMVETADPVRSPLAAIPALSADATPYARLRVAQLALKVEAQRLALDTEKGRLLDAATANSAINEIAGAMRDALLNWPTRVSGLIAADLGADRYGDRFWQRPRTEVADAPLLAPPVAPDSGTAAVSTTPAADRSQVRPRCWLAPRGGWLRG